jgi:hypothetical protein
MTLIAMLLVAAQAAASVGSKPDFSGQWVLNASESDFGLIPQPPCRGLKLAHREPELLVEETGPGGEPCGQTIRYTTDGTLVTYVANSVRRQARLTWRGNVLVINRTDDDGVTMRIEATLSADGRKITRAYSLESPQGATNWSYVYDRAR